MTDPFSFGPTDGGPDKKDGGRNTRYFGMANYDLDDKVAVDLSDIIENGDEPVPADGGETQKPVTEEVPSGETEEPEEIPQDDPEDREPRIETKKARAMGSAAENSRRLAENIRRREREAEEAEKEEEDRKKDIFGDYAENASETGVRESTLIAEAERKRDKNRNKKRKKLEKEEQRENEENEIWDVWLQRKSFYVAVAAFLATVILIIVCAVSMTAGASKAAVTGGLTEVHQAVDQADDGTTVYSILSSYRDFLAHDAGVRNDASGPEKSAFPTPREAATPYVKVTPDPAATPFEMPTEIPEDLTPEPTPAKPTSGNLVVSADEDFYIFDLSEKSYSSVHLKSGDYYTSGVGRDTAGELTVSPSGKDIEYGFLRIQNPYSCEGFDLRSVLQSPLVIKQPTDKSTPVILYYTHTSESYCVTADERKISAFPSIAGYDKSRSIAGRGDLLRKACQAEGINVALIDSVNDKAYDKAYEVSGSAVEALAAKTPTVQLALDIHVNSFEYPSGQRYAPTVTVDGKQYAKILFVVVQNDETNPGWKENIKLAMLIIEKLEKQVPGITLGISLRNDAKYNSAATKFGLLAEIGFEGNLVTEADASAELLGSTVGRIFRAAD